MKKFNNNKDDIRKLKVINIKPYHVFYLKRIKTIGKIIGTLHC